MKIVISGSVKMSERIGTWVAYWRSQPDAVLLDYPEKIRQENFLRDYATVFQNYFSHLDNTDVLFVANGLKDNVAGYIGAGMFSEIAYVVSHIARGAAKWVILAEQPAQNLFCHDELKLWMELGWVTVFDAV